jgi:hypothetical protein
MVLTYVWLCEWCDELRRDLEGFSAAAPSVGHAACLLGDFDRISGPLSSVVFGRLLDVVVASGAEFEGGRAGAAAGVGATQAGFAGTSVGFVLLRIGMFWLCVFQP